jgi:hypothetical protein
MNLSIEVPISFTFNLVYKPTCCNIAYDDIAPFIRWSYICNVLSILHQCVIFYNSSNFYHANLH